MIRIQITEPNISDYEIEKISGRKNIGTWLNNRGIYNWTYDFGSRIFIAEVEDTFNLSTLDQWGTVEVLPNDPDAE